MKFDSCEYLFSETDLELTGSLKRGSNCASKSRIIRGILGVPGQHQRKRSRNFMKIIA